MAGRMGGMLIARRRAGRTFGTTAAFSSSDVLPLTARAKLLRMVEVIISLITVALVAFRAVRILQ